MRAANVSVSRRRYWRPWTTPVLDCRAAKTLHISGQSGVLVYRTVVLRTPWTTRCELLEMRVSNPAYRRCLRGAAIVSISLFCECFAAPRSRLLAWNVCVNSQHVLRTRIRIAGKASLRSASLVVKLVFKDLPGSKMVFEDVRADLFSLMRSRLLVEAEVDPAIDAGIINVVGNLFPVAVIEDNSWQSGVGQGDGVATLAESLFKHLVLHRTRSHGLMHRWGAPAW